MGGGFGPAHNHIYIYIDVYIDLCIAFFVCLHTYFFILIAKIVQGMRFAVAGVRRCRPAGHRA